MSTNYQPHSGSQSTTGGFDHAIVGYRGDTAQVMALLRRRRTQPFSEKHCLRQETRWAAMYCTVDEFKLGALMRASKLRREQAHAMLAYYGIDYRTRNIVSEGGAR